jgi:hypothetical protein
MLSNTQIAQRESFLQKPVDGLVLKELFFAGLTWLRTNQQLVNSLNVFPVPDGDTGTNMVLTLQSAYNEISGSMETNAGDMAHMLSNGALMGARGNSGVIYPSSCEASPGAWTTCPSSNRRRWSRPSEWRAILLIKAWCAR